MASSIAFDREWLRKSIEDGSTRFYSFDDFTDSVLIGCGGYGVVFKAKAKTLGRTIAYKLLYSQDDDESFENFMKEVCSHNNNTMLIFWVLLFLPKVYIYTIAEDSSQG